MSSAFDRPSAPQAVTGVPMPLSVPAFIYHGIFDGLPPSGIAPGEYRYFLSRDALGAQLNFLQRRAVRALSLDEWLGPAESRPRPSS